jgi:hypothetical protein
MGIRVSDGNPRPVSQQTYHDTHLCCHRMVWRSDIRTLPVGGSGQAMHRAPAGAQTLVQPPCGHASGDGTSSPMDAKSRDLVAAARLAGQGAPRPQERHCTEVGFPKTRSSARSGGSSTVAAAQAAKPPGRSGRRLAWRYPEGRATLYVLGGAAGAGLMRRHSSLPGSRSWKRAA